MAEKIKISAVATDRPAKLGKRKLGRPSKGGDPVLVRLTALERSLAVSIGNGVVAEGIRLALKAAGQLGVENVRLLTAQPAAEKGKNETSD